MTAPRSRSLFWTFAGVFLLVLLAASVVQFVVGIAVLRPLAERGARDRAELMVAEAARTLGSLGVLDDESIREALRLGLPARGRTIVVFVRGDGRAYFDRRLPPPLRMRVAGLLGLPGPGLAGPEDQGLPGGPPAPQEMPGGPPDGGPFGGGPPPHDLTGRPGGGPPDAGAPGGGPGPGLPSPEEMGGAFSILARREVTRGPEVLGTVAAVGPLGPPGPWGEPRAGTALLLVPLAMVAAAAAGLVMVRILVRRLRALDMLAARVAAGDLSARVADSSGDEIGRLGERLDLMIERLAAARATLESTDRQRRQLFTDITHELATPLTSIRGYTETLLDPAIETSPAERSTYLGHVLEEAKRLDLLIRDLLELARLESGTIPLAIERLDWAALCANTTQRFAQRFRAAGLNLRWRGPESGAWVRGDGRRIEQVLDNLLQNALRYVPGGGTVELALEPGGAQHHLTVDDDGPGIHDEDLPHVFERFWRARAARESGGSGLGLAIVREIVHLHGGTVAVEPRSPRGTRFAVTLPAEAAG